MFRRKLVGMSAAPDGPARRCHHGVGRVRQPPGAAVVVQRRSSRASGRSSSTAGSQQGGLLRKHRTFGGAAFAFPESKPREKATGSLFSTASGQTYGVLAQAPSAAPFQPGLPKGGLTHLDQFQAYEKQSKNASLRLTITKAVVDAIDANHALVPSECPPRLELQPDPGHRPVPRQGLRRVGGR